MLCINKNLSKFRKQSQKLVLDMKEYSKILNFLEKIRKSQNLKNSQSFGKKISKCQKYEKISKSQIQFVVSKIEMSIFF